MDNPTNIQPSLFGLFGETTRRSHLDEPVMGHFSRITFHFPGFIILGFKRLKRYENLKYEQFQKILERLLGVVLIFTRFVHSY